jgi:NO-binding membrane sensor protein with MHYT domain
VTPLGGSYDSRLVALSVLIAILAAGAALDLAGRVTATHGRARALWLAGGALAMGLGIWSMHYTGMLAFALPVPVHYHVPTVALSLIAAVLASVVALLVASRERLNAARVAAGSVVMGAGVAAMHYTGMAAMRLAATTAWNTSLVALSVVIAGGVSAVALWLAFRYGQAAKAAWTWRKAASAVVMGAAIPSMHYTAMAAASFTASAATVDLGETVSASVLGAYAVAAGTLLVLLVAVATSVVDRRFAAQAAALAAARAEVNTLRGLLPICANCKRVRTDQGSWEQIESYVRDRTNAEFSHGICPECAAKTWGASG